MRILKTTTFIYDTFIYFVLFIFCHIKIRKKYIYYEVYKYVSYECCVMTNTDMISDTMTLYQNKIFVLHK